jgi:hypothetical protein
MEDLTVLGASAAPCLMVSASTSCSPIFHRQNCQYIQDLSCFIATYRIGVHRLSNSFYIAMTSNETFLLLRNGLSKTPALNRADEVDDVS